MRSDLLSLRAAEYHGNVVGHISKMKKSVEIVVWLSIMSLLSSCTHKEANDEAEILSLIYNTQIANQEHYGAAPPVQPLPPDFDELNRYGSTEEARQHLKSKEWIDYFDEKTTYSSKVLVWQERMRTLDRTILFRTNTEINEHYRDLAKRELKDLNYNLDFIEKPISWQISDIENKGKYWIMDLADFGEVKLDTIHVGVLQFSEIGFNESRDTAILYYDWHCGKLCGGGTLTILNKKCGRWRILINLDLWVA